MAETMYRVTGQAKARNVAGQQYNTFWSGGKSWSATDETVNVLTQAQLDDVKRDEAGGFPIKVIKVEEIPEGEVQAATSPEKPQATASAPGSDQAAAAAGAAAGETPKPAAPPASDLRTQMAGTSPAGSPTPTPTPAPTPTPVVAPTPTPPAETTPSGAAPTTQSPPWQKPPGT